MATATTTRWQLKGQGYEFCNCDFGCGRNFGGFPNSKDGSCRALVGLNIGQGACAARLAPPIGPDRSPASNPREMQALIALWSTIGPSAPFLVEARVEHALHHQRQGEAVAPGTKEG